MSKPLRATMPTVAAWIDSLRAAFGAEAIDAQIRNGQRGEGLFYAAENGVTLGHPLDESRFKVVAGRDLVTAPLRKEATRGR